MPAAIDLDKFNQPYYKYDSAKREWYCTKCGFERQAEHGVNCPAHPLNTKPFGIGSKVWTVDRWNRRYNPIVEEEVVGETRVSWLLGRGQQTKLPKKECDKTYVAVKVWNGHERVWLDFAAMADAIWGDANQYAIIEQARRADAGTLRAIAKLIGYVEKE